MILTKNFLLLFAFIHLASCVHNLEGVKNVESNNMAAVISGCKLVTKGMFGITLKDKCSAVWKNEKTGEEFIVDDIMSVNFVKPGTYEFIAGYSSSISYKKYPESIFVLKGLTVKGGDVLYIGHLDIDLTKAGSKPANALEGFDIEKDLNAAKEHLMENYPDLADKMKYRPMEFSKEARHAKAIFELFNKNKK